MAAVRGGGSSPGVPARVGPSATLGTLLNMFVINLYFSSLRSGRSATSSTPTGTRWRRRRRSRSDRSCPRCSATSNWRISRCTPTRQRRRMPCSSRPSSSRPHLSSPGCGRASLRRHLHDPPPRRPARQAPATLLPGTALAQAERAATPGQLERAGRGRRPRHHSRARMESATPGARLEVTAGTYVATCSSIAPSRSSGVDTSTTSSVLARAA